MHVHMQTLILDFMCMHVCVYILYITHINTYAYTYTHIYIYIYIHIYTYAYTYTYTYTSLYLFNIEIFIAQIAFVASPSATGSISPAGASGQRGSGGVGFGVWR